MTTYEETCKNIEIFLNYILDNEKDMIRDKVLSYFSDDVKKNKKKLRIMATLYVNKFFMRQRRTCFINDNPVQILKSAFSLIHHNCVLEEKEYNIENVIEFITYLKYLTTVLESLLEYRKDDTEETYHWRLYKSGYYDDILVLMDYEDDYSVNFIIRNMYSMGLLRQR